MTPEAVTAAALDVLPVGSVVIGIDGRAAQKTDHDVWLAAGGGAYLSATLAASWRPRIVWIGETP